MWLESEIKISTSQSNKKKKITNSYLKLFHTSDIQFRLSLPFLHTTSYFVMLFNFVFNFLNYSNKNSSISIHKNNLPIYCFTKCINGTNIGQ